MSFLERAKQAANQAAEQARQAAEQARQVATDSASAAAHAAERASATLSDPATSERAKLTLNRARRGLATAIDRIDPGVLADVIIKATALQERTNQALRARHSPYRISEIGIGAAIPPSVTFSIARIDDAGEVIEAAVSSTELAAAVAADDPGTIRALDGTALDETALDGATDPAIAG
jgi:hypothetical protein